ncbi:hypothetical protein QFC22_001006 [Naganishia vaughanmartiniae]|uniref:Uncharacterized protein n=1 Tax=Naganishia vaughanmartiniae TaxID=1424756 RepID=A0ACC2XJN7_9TREE|nr:hypothetical protein QFC22_001006 [Naganishia vaughanmartiniae]
MADKNIPFAFVIPPSSLPPVSARRSRCVIRGVIDAAANKVEVAMSRFLILLGHLCKSNKGAFRWVGAQDVGSSKLECISLPINPAVGRQQANPFADSSDPTKDLWLVLKVGTFELPLLPTHKISKSTAANGAIVFTIPSPHSPSGPMLELRLAPIASPEDKEDYETFEILLKQYGCLPLSQVSREIKGSAAIASPSSSDLVGMATTPSVSASSQRTPPPVPPKNGLSNGPAPGTASPRARTEAQEGGRFVLVDEETGQVIGELDNRIDVEVGSGVNASRPGTAAGEGKSAEPVVVDFGEMEEGWAQKVTVQTVDEKDLDDWMLKGAHYISTASKSMTGAAELYIRNTKPRAEPVKFSSGTKEGIRQVHNVSAKGVKVTKKTMDTVNNAIGRVVEVAADKGYGGYDKAQTIWKTNYTSPDASRRPSVATDGQQLPPPYAEKPSALQVDTKMPENMSQSQQPATAPPLPSRKETAASPAQQKQPQTAQGTQRPFWNRVFLAAEVIGTSLEATTQTLITSGTNAAAEAAGHKYGAEAGEAARILGGSVRNVALVYVDVRGVGRKTLFKSTAKGFKGVVKTRLTNGKEVTITGQDENGNLKIADGDHAAQDVSIGMAGVGLNDGTPGYSVASPDVGGQGDAVADSRKMKKMQ